MSYYKIEGGHRLCGEVDIHGAKNSALPILAATLLNAGENVIHNCPALSDIDNTTEILEYLGCKVTRNGTDIIVDSSGITGCEIPGFMMQKTRSSTLFAGALAARCRQVVIYASGGCCIGSRPIDFHLKAFKKMGMNVSEYDDRVVCNATNLRPCCISLTFPSVGTTENIMLAASLTPGRTTIINAASEPEISNLAEFLRSMGVRVTGDGTSVITVNGTLVPGRGEVTVIGDRIVAATYAVCTATAGGRVEIRGVNPGHLSPVLALLRQMGVCVKCGADRFEVDSFRRPVNVPVITTGPYPYFPTDCQPLITALMVVSSGVGVVRETIFENRFGHCERLVKMGADILVRGGTASVKGVKRLTGAGVDSCDLRCGAALVSAALGAEGTSHISNIHYIERGYEDLCGQLCRLGATAERID